MKLGRSGHGARRAWAWLAVTGLIILVVAGPLPLSAQRRVTPATPIAAGAPVSVTVGEMMALASASPVAARPLLRPEFEGPDREDLPQNPGASSSASRFPAGGDVPFSARQTLAPQTLGTQFTGATGPTETVSSPFDNSQLEPGELGEASGDGIGLHGANRRYGNRELRDREAAGCDCAALVEALQLLRGVARNHASGSARGSDGERGRRVCFPLTEIWRDTAQPVGASAGKTKLI